MEMRYLIMVEIVIFLVAFFLGWHLCKILWNRKPDGVLRIGKNGDCDEFRWIFNYDMEDFKLKRKLYIKVENSQNSQVV